VVSDRDLELRRAVLRIEAILRAGRWPTGLELTKRERELLEVALSDARDRAARRGAWAREA
jgi:hypothetical protein